MIGVINHFRNYLGRHRILNTTLDYDIEYNTQLGDDKEKIFVEVSNLE